MAGMSSNFHIGVAMIHSLKRHGVDPKVGAEPARLELNQQVRIDCSSDDVRAFIEAIQNDSRSTNAQPNIEIEMPALSPNGERTYITGILTEKYFFSPHNGKMKLRASGEELDWIDTVLSLSTDNFLAKRVQQRTYRMT